MQVIISIRKQYRKKFELGVVSDSRVTMGVDLGTFFKNSNITEKLMSSISCEMRLISTAGEFFSDADN